MWERTRKINRVSGPVEATPIYALVPPGCGKFRDRRAFRSPSNRDCELSSQQFDHEIDHPNSGPITNKALKAVSAFPKPHGWVRIPISVGFRSPAVESLFAAGTVWRLPTLTCEGQKAIVDDLVFVTRFGNPSNVPTVTHRFQELVRRAGIGHHRFHDLRHTAANLLAFQGVHPRAIQAALGWENLSMLNRYAHFVEEQTQAVASAMDPVFEPGGCQHPRGKAELNAM
jgi:hypothetical protein